MCEKIYPVNLLNRLMSHNLDKIDMGTHCEDIDE